MTRTVDFGRKLSGEEYERRAVALYSGAPPLSEENQDRELRRRELDLQIDHRLGVDFPVERREKLFEVQCGLDRVDVGSLIRYALGWVMPSFLVRHARFLAEDTVRAYGKVLSEEKLRAFLDLEAGKPVRGMPVDMRQPVLVGAILCVTMIQLRSASASGGVRGSVRASLHRSFHSRAQIV